MVRRRIFKHERLWRDKTPGIHEEQGSIIHIKLLTDAEYDEQLRLKLLEESHEVQDANIRTDLIEEIADVYEVIDALCMLHSIDKQEIVRIQEEKRERRGGFFKRMYVTTSEHEEGSTAERYCSQDREKYPLVEE